MMLRRSTANAWRQDEMFLESSRNPTRLEMNFRLTRICCKWVPEQNDQRSGANRVGMQMCNVCSEGSRGISKSYRRPRKHAIATKRVKDTNRQKNSGMSHLLCLSDELGRRPRGQPRLTLGLCLVLRLEFCL